MWSSLCNALYSDIIMLSLTIRMWYDNLNDTADQYYDSGNDFQVSFLLNNPS